LSFSASTNFAILPALTSYKKADMDSFVGSVGLGKAYPTFKPNSR